jgi:hypothetical protein
VREGAVEWVRNDKTDRPDPRPTPLATYRYCGGRQALIGRNLITSFWSVVTCALSMKSLTAGSAPRPAADVRNELEAPPASPKPSSTCGGGGPVRTADRWGWGGPDAGGRCLGTRRVHMRARKGRSAGRLGASSRWCRQQKHERAGWG